jgi:hypothetical protein
MSLHSLSIEDDNLAQWTNVKNGCLIFNWANVSGVADIHIHRPSVQAQTHVQWFTVDSYQIYNRMTVDSQWVHNSITVELKWISNESTVD